MGVIQIALKLITAPAAEPVTLAEAKSQLRVDGTDDDTLITGLIKNAREYCEAFQNRAMVTQTWDLWLGAWPSGDHIEIPLPPLQSVTSVKYYGTDDTEYILAATEYDTDDKGYKGRVALKYGKSWPTTTLRPSNAVVVRFVAGYGDAATAVPQKVKQAMMLDIKLNYDDYPPPERERLEKARDALLWLERVSPI